MVQIPNRVTIQSMGDAAPWIELFVAILAVASMWGAMRSTVTSLKRDIEQLETACSALARQVQNLHHDYVTQKFFESTIQEIYRNQSRIEGDMRMLHGDIKEVLRLLGTRVN